MGFTQSGMEPTAATRPADAVPIPLREPRPLTAMLWMAGTGVLFVGVTALVKTLDGRVPAAQAGFLRYALGIVFLLPLLPTLRRLHLTARDFGIFALRGTLQALGVICWFYAMSRITIAEVTAMNYLVPVYITVGAALFLGERLAIRRVLAVAAALAGALVILRPGFRSLDPGHLAMMATALVFAGSYLIAKRLTDRAGAAVVVLMLSLTVPVALLPFALAVWEPVAPADLLVLLAVAAFATGGHYCMTRAFADGPMAVTQPVTFLQLVWAAALGALLFAEPIDLYVVLGGAVIFGSVTFIAIREAQLKTQEKLRKP